eukprot:21467-Heterococcus_DN1.PRE.2
MRAVQSSVQNAAVRHRCKHEGFHSSEALHISKCSYWCDACASQTTARCVQRCLNTVTNQRCTATGKIPQCWCYALPNSRRLRRPAGSTDRSH